MLTKEEQLKEWDRVVAMCKGTKFGGKEYLCVKSRYSVTNPYKTYEAFSELYFGYLKDRIFAVAIVDDIPIWLEAPFRLYTKDKNDLVFVYDEERYGLVGVIDYQAKSPVLAISIKVFIPICNVIWDNFTLTKPSEAEIVKADTSKSYQLDSDYIKAKVGIVGVDTKQVGGSHYKDKAIQPWAYMEANYTKEEFIGFLRGNAHKYLDRYKDKNGVEDLKKAIHYIEKLTEIEDK